MYRRAVLALLASASLSGCSGVLPDRRPGDAERSGRKYEALAIVGVAPEGGDRNGIDGEYVRIENTGSDPVDVEGVELRYGNGLTYTFDGQSLESGAVVFLKSRTAEESTYLMAPPAYVRSAGFARGPNTTVLEESGRVRLVSPEGASIDEYEYSLESDSTTAA